MSTTTVSQETVVSKDGTWIGFSRQGDGPSLILVDGAMCHRSFGPMGALAGVLASRFTVYTYDRRGRGTSGDTQPYAVAREVEDIEAVIASAGGSAGVYGISSGAALALKAADACAGIRRLAIYEPPFLAALPGNDQIAEYGRHLHALLAAGRRGDAVELFLKTVGTPPQAIAGMRVAPAWQLMEAIAPTLGHDSDILGDGTVPAIQAGRLRIPVMVMAGSASPEGLRAGSEAAASEIPGSRFEVLPGQTHDVSPGALAPVLTGFFLPTTRAR